MAEYLTKDFINLSDRGFSPYRTSELALNHREGGLYIRPLMIMSKKGFSIEVVEVPHPLPESIERFNPLTALRITPERDIGCGVYCLNSVEIILAGVGFVSRYLVDGEGLGGSIDQLGKLRGIGCLGRCGLNTGHYVGFDSAHQVGFNPFRFAPHLTPLMVKPSVIGGSGESRRINGEVSLYGSKWTGTPLNEGFQQRCQFGVFQIAGITGEGRGFSDKRLCFRFSDVRHETSAGHRGVGFINDSEYNIRQWQAGSPEGLHWLGNAITQIPEQYQKSLLFVHLSIIVGSPLLSAGHLDGFGIGNAAVWSGFSLDNILNCMNMFAGLVSFLIVGASAEWLVVVEVYDVSSVAGFRRDFPTQFVFLDFACFRYPQPSFSSRIHFTTPQLLFCGYHTIHCIHLSIPFTINIYNIYEEFSRWCFWLIAVMAGDMGGRSYDLKNLESASIVNKTTTAAISCCALLATSGAIPNVSSRVIFYKTPVLDSVYKIAERLSPPYPRHHEYSILLHAPIHFDRGGL